MHRSTQASIRDAALTTSKEMVIATMKTTTQGVIGMVVTAVHQPVHVDTFQSVSAPMSVANDRVVIVVSSVRVCVLLRD